MHPNTSCTPPHAFPALLLLLALTATTPGCGYQDPAYEHTYTVRGQVLSLPGELATQEFIVQHETIPNYLSINGSIGMHAMAMPFPVPDRSALKDLSVGDKIELTFGESFKPKHTMGVISIQKLPAETELDFSTKTHTP